MSVRIKRGTSRLTHAQLIVIDGIEFWTRPELPELTPSSNDIQHEVSVPERIDNIAKKRYQQDGRWWVIAHRNDLRVLPGDIMPGQRITITDPSQVRKELF